MPTRDWQLRIVDMEEAAQRILTYAKGMTAKAFVADGKTMDAVIRNVEIVGEAAARIPASVQKRHPDIRWKDIRGMRNILVHAYFRVDAKILWQVTQKDVPELAVQLASLREAEGF